MPLLRRSRTIVRPTVLIFLRNIRLAATRLRFDPQGIRRCLAPRVRELDPDFRPLAVRELDDSLEGRDMTVRP
jgi:hypothetical protein